MSYFPKVSPRKSEEFLSPASCKHLASNMVDEDDDKQNADRERIVCSIALDVQYELSNPVREPGAHMPRLRPFNPRMCGPACPHPYTGRFLTEDAYTRLRGDPVGLGRELEKEKPYDPALYATKDPRLITKTMVVRDYGCKIPIDINDTTLIAKAVLNEFPDHYVQFLNEFVSNLFGASMRRWLDLQQAGLQKLLDDDADLNRISWGSYISAQGGGLELEDPATPPVGAPARQQESYGGPRDCTLTFDKEILTALGTLTREGRSMTGACSAQDVFDLRPCLRQHIETLREMKEEWCQGFGSSEENVLAMLTWINDQGRNQCQDLQLMEESDTPDYSKIGLLVPWDVFSKVDKPTSCKDFTPDQNPEIRKNGKSTCEDEVYQTLAGMQPVGQWCGIADTTNVFLKTVKASEIMWGWGHACNLHMRRKVPKTGFTLDYKTTISSTIANAEATWVPYLRYASNDSPSVYTSAPGPNPNQLEIGNKSTIVYVKKDKWGADDTSRTNIVRALNPVPKKSLRDSLIDDYKNEPSTFFRGSNKFRAVDSAREGVYASEEAAPNVEMRARETTLPQKVCASDDELPIRSLVEFDDCDYLDPFLREGQSGCLRLGEDNGLEVDGERLGPFNMQSILTRSAKMKAYLKTGYGIPVVGKKAEIANLRETLRLGNNAARILCLQSYYPSILAQFPTQEEDNNFPYAFKPGHDASDIYFTLAALIEERVRASLIGGGAPVTYGQAWYDEILGVGGGNATRAFTFDYMNEVRVLKRGRFDDVQEKILNDWTEFGDDRFNHAFSNAAPLYTMDVMAPENRNFAFRGIGDIAAFLGYRYDPATFPNVTDMLTEDNKKKNTFYKNLIGDGAALASAVTAILETVYNIDHVIQTPTMNGPGPDPVYERKMNALNGVFYEFMLSYDKEDLNPLFFKHMNDLVERFDLNKALLKVQSNLLKDITWKKKDNQRYIELEDCKGYMGRTVLPGMSLGKGDVQKVFHETSSHVVDARVNSSVTNVRQLKKEQAGNMHINTIDMSMVTLPKKVSSHMNGVSSQVDVQNIYLKEQMKILLLRSVLQMSFDATLCALLMYNVFDVKFNNTEGQQQMYDGNAFDAPPGRFPGYKYDISARNGMPVLSEPEMCTYNVAQRVMNYPSFVNMFKVKHNIDGINEGRVQEMNELTLIPPIGEPAVQASAQTIQTFWNNRMTDFELINQGGKFCLAVKGSSAALSDEEAYREVLKMVYDRIVKRMTILFGEDDVEKKKLTDAYLLNLTRSVSLADEYDTFTDAFFHDKEGARSLPSEMIMQNSTPYMEYNVKRHASDVQNINQRAKYTVWHDPSYLFSSTYNTYKKNCKTDNYRKMLKTKMKKYCNDQTLERNVFERIRTLKRNFLRNLEEGSPDPAKEILDEVYSAQMTPNPNSPAWVRYSHWAVSLTDVYVTDSINDYFAILNQVYINPTKTLHENWENTDTGVRGAPARRDANDIFTYRGEYSRLRGFESIFLYDYVYNKSANKKPRSFDPLGSWDDAKIAYAITYLQLWETRVDDWAGTFPDLPGFLPSTDNPLDNTVTLNTFSQSQEFQTACDEFFSCIKRNVTDQVGKTGTNFVVQFYTGKMNKERTMRGIMDYEDNYFTNRPRGFPNSTLDNTNTIAEKICSDIQPVDKMNNNLNVEFLFRPFDVTGAVTKPLFQGTLGQSTFNVNALRPGLFSMLDAAATLWNARAFFNPGDAARPTTTEVGQPDEQHYWVRTLLETFVYSRAKYKRDNPTRAWEETVKINPQDAMPASQIGSLCDESFRALFPLLPLNHPLRDKLRRCRAMEVVWGTLPSYSPNEKGSLGQKPGAWMPLSVHHQMKLYETVGLFDTVYRVPRNPWSNHNGQGIGRVFLQSYHSVYYCDSWRAPHFREWVKSACRYQMPRPGDGCYYPFSQYGGTPVEADFVRHRRERPDEGHEYRSRMLAYNRFGFTDSMRLGNYFEDNGLLQDMFSFQYRPHAKLSAEQRAMKPADAVYISNFLSYARNHAIIALASCNQGTQDGSIPLIVRNLYRMYVDTYECMGAKVDDDSVPAILGFASSRVTGDRPITLVAGSLTCMNAKLKAFCESEANQGERVCQNYKQVYFNEAAILFSRLVRAERRRILHNNNFLRATMHRPSNYRREDFDRELIDLQDTYIDFLQTTIVGMLLENGADLHNVPLHLLEPRELEVSVHDEDPNMVPNDFLTPRTVELLKTMDFSKHNLTRSQLAILSLIPPNNRILGTMRLDQNTEIIDMEHVRKQIQKETIASNKQAWKRYSDALVSAAFAQKLLEVEGPMDFAFDMSSLEDPVFPADAIRNPLAMSEGIAEEIATSQAQTHTRAYNTNVYGERLRKSKAPDSVLGMNTAEFRQALEFQRRNIEEIFQKTPGTRPTRLEICKRAKMPELVRRILIQRLENEDR